MAELIANILEIVDDIMFWKRKKKRRKFEKENNLPKKDYDSANDNNDRGSFRNINTI